jgi:hypothetical protein
MTGSSSAAATSSLRMKSGQVSGMSYAPGNVFGAFGICGDHRVGGAGQRQSCEPLMLMNGH